MMSQAPEATAFVKIPAELNTMADTVTRIMPALWEFFWIGRFMSASYPRFGLIDLHKSMENTRAFPDAPLSIKIILFDGSPF